MSGLAAALWLDQLLRQAGRPELTIRPYELTYLAAVVGLATVGAVLAARRRRVTPSAGCCWSWGCR